MAAVDMNVLFNTLKTGVADLAKATMKDYVSQATKDGQNVLKMLKNDIATWSDQLASGALGTDDLKFLVQGRKELIQMKALQQAGIGQIQLEKFEDGVLDLIVGTLSKLL